MSTPLIPMITSAGLAAVFNATDNGLEAVITEIALGDVAWSPDDTAAALQNEVVRLPVAGERISDKQIHLSAVENGTTEYWVREVGFYLDDGTLLCIWSVEDAVLAYKSADVDLLFSLDLVLDALPANSVTVDGTAGFNLPASTTEKRGIIQLADAPESIAGVENTKAMTPYTTKVSTSLPFALMDYPEVITADNRLTVTPASAAAGGTVSITGGSIIYLGKETETGIGYSGVFTTPAFTSADLAANSTYYLRCQITNNQPLLYMQQGTDADAIPAGKKGTPGGAAGGGFDSTPVDTLLAKIVTTAAGSVPTVTALANARQLKVADVREGSVNRAINWTQFAAVAINWARKARVTHVALSGAKDSVSAIGGGAANNQPLTHVGVRSNNSTRYTLNLEYCFEDNTAVDSGRLAAAYILDA